MANHVPAKVPLAGNVISVMIQMITFAVLAICLTRRTQNIKKWTSLPMATWLIIIIYVDSTLFVFATAIVTRGLGINSSQGVCEGGILLCLVCYMSTKILIYYFLVEKAYIIRGSRYPRLKTKLWLFNCLGMLLPYGCLVILNFIYRIAYINDDGVCIIGMQKIAMLPLIIFEVIVNIYLTLLFIIPLRKLYSYQHNKNATLHSIAFRSFIGSCATLTSSVVNLTILMVLKGEPGWICLMCCNADTLFSILVLHWVTQIDRPQTSTAGASHGTGVHNSRIQTSKPEKDDEIVKSQRRSTDGWQSPEPISEPPKSLTVGSITTEITASSLAKGGKRGRQHRRNTSGSRAGFNDDEVQLNEIRVHTHQTREVLDLEGSGRGRSGSGEADSYDISMETSGRSVSAEKIV